MSPKGNSFWRRTALLGAGLVWLLAQRRFRSLVYRMAPQDNWLVHQHIAHRGLHLPGIPENSLAAFEQAIADGYAIELDVQYTGDGIPVVFHDDSLLRLTGVDRLLRHCCYAELRQLRLQHSNQHIPTLAEVLQVVAGRTPLLIEVKNSDMPGSLEDTTIAMLRAYDGSYVVQSFNPYVVRYFAQYAPEMTRGQLLERPSWFTPDSDIARHALVVRDNVFCWLGHPHFLNYQYTCLQDTDIAPLRRQGVPVLAWTLHRSDLASANYKRFADNIVVDP